MVNLKVFAFLMGASGLAFGQAAPVYPPLNVPQRVALLKSVLKERQWLYGQPVAVEGCKIAKAVGDSTIDVSQLSSPASGITVVGTATRCMYPSENPTDGRAVGVHFDQIRFENNEFVPMPGPNMERPPDMLVVRAVITQGQRSHLEEWVMRPVFNGSWRAVTVRVFGIGQG